MQIGSYLDQVLRAEELAAETGQPYAGPDRSRLDGLEPITGSDDFEIVMSDDFKERWGYSPRSAG